MCAAYPIFYAVFARRCFISLQSRRVTQRLLQRIFFNVVRHFHIPNSSCFPLMMANSRTPSFASCTCFIRAMWHFSHQKKKTVKEQPFPVDEKKQKHQIGFLWMTLNWLEIFLSWLFSRGSLLEESVEQIRTLMKKTLEKNEDIAANDLFRKWSFHPEALQDVHNFRALGEGGGVMCAFNPPHLMSCWFGPSEPISQRGYRVRGAKSHVEGLIKQYGPQRPFHIHVLQPHP